jgi:hypothetical protein
VGDIGSVGHATPPVRESAEQLAENAKRREAPQARPRAGRSGRKPSARMRAPAPEAKTKRL